MCSRHKGAQKPFVNPMKVDAVQCLRRRTESRTADTMKPQLSQSPSAISVYSVPLKFSDLSFVDITGSKGKSLFTREGLGMGGEACRGRGWACLALLWIPLCLARAGCSIMRLCGDEFPCCLNYFWNANLQGLVHMLIPGEKTKPCHTVLGFVLLVCFCGFHSPQVN